MSGLNHIWNELGQSLRENEEKIITHINTVHATNRRTKIESVFATSFLGRFHKNDYRTEVEGSDFGIKNWFPGHRVNTRLDCFFPYEGLAIEFKAGRIPRNYGNELYDISQVASDIMRLRDSRHPSIEAGYIILFVYGPLVEGTSSRLELYRAVHHSYLVDYLIGRGDGLGPRDEIAQKAHCARCELLGWNRPWTGRALPPGCIVKRTSRIGAICIDCEPGARIPKSCWADYATA